MIDHARKLSEVMYCMAFNHTRRQHIDTTESRTPKHAKQVKRNWGLVYPLESLTTHPSLSLTRRVLRQL